jgi:hypothetical protein
MERDMPTHRKRQDGIIEPYVLAVWPNGVRVTRAYSKKTNKFLQEQRLKKVSENNRKAK